MSRGWSRRRGGMSGESKLTPKDKRLSTKPETNSFCQRKVDRFLKRVREAVLVWDRILSLIIAVLALLKMTNSMVLVQWPLKVEVALSIQTSLVKRLMVFWIETSTQ